MAQYLPANHGTVIHSLSLTGDAEPMAVTYGIYAVDISAPGDPVPTAGVVAELHDAFGDIIVPFLSTEMSLTQTELRFVQPGTVDPVLAIDTTVRVGGTSGTMLPQNSALLVHKRSAEAGRRGRGRLYVPSILREAQVDNKGLIASVELAGLQTAFSAFLTRVQGNTTPADTDKEMVILHEPSGADPTPTGTFVTSLQCDVLIATQRRRLRK